MERDIGFPSQDKIIESCEMIKNFINTHDYVIEKASTQVSVKSVYDSGFTVGIYFYYNPQESISAFKIKSDLRKELVKFVEENNIYFPYKHVVFTMDQDDQNIVSTLSAT